MRPRLQPLRSPLGAALTAAACAGTDSAPITGMREVLLECFFKGARANLSEYGCPPVPPIELTDGGKAVLWEFEPSEGALEGLV